MHQGALEGCRQSWDLPDWVLTGAVWRQQGEQTVGGGDGEWKTALVPAGDPEGARCGRALDVPEAEPTGFADGQTWGVTERKRRRDLP